MREFGSLGEFAGHLATRELAVNASLRGALERIARKIEGTAKGEIGHYQAAVGPFDAWPALADVTEERKAAMGYPLGAPLLATGEMQASITHQVEGLEAVIGSPDEKLFFHEFGTSTAPARPVMGPAAYRNKDAIHRELGAAVVSGLIGGDVIHEALGYNFRIGD